MNHFKAITITKIDEGIIDVPVLPPNAELDQGIYIMMYHEIPIKVGCFGEGVTSNSKSRFATYRTVGNNLYEYLNGSKKQNGSVKTIKLINENLSKGESVDVYFKPLPASRVLEDGYTYKVDLYIEENKLKNKYKNSLWLT